MRKFWRSAFSAVLAAAAVPIALLSVQQPAQALENNLARTPQLGWNDWNSFGCNVNETLVRQTADVMVSSGMAAAGYQYVNIDDCWSEWNRDSSGNLVPDHTKFPSGMKALADYVHGKGLKLGIYSSAGTTTCQGYPASLGNEQRDANLWASWGIDYLKYDNCGDHQGRSGQDRYVAMRDALAKSGRPILFAICNWGGDSVNQWGPATGNSWRTTWDIQGNWGSVLGILDAQPGWAGLAKPGAWNDPDMLEVGNGLSDTEARAHFSLWALLNAPLLAGNDLRTMSAATRSILTNTEVIGVNQDWGGRQGNRIADYGDTEVWTKPMANGSMAVVLLNRGSGTSTISTSASQIGLGSASSYSVRDLWAHSTGTTSGAISASVPGHGAAMYVVTGGGVANPGTFALRGQGSGRCLDITGASQANGTPAEIWDCHGGANQAFTSTAAGELRVYGNTKCLDVSGNATANGTAVAIWDCTGGGNQQFRLNGDGSITAVGANKCLDVNGAATANGSKVQIWDCSGGSNQKWAKA
ncbi:alpha-galactosidase [Amycolatopsis mediterranei S699]|uniref:Alpha-galactosidase n=2 Tax=Amycolatopsis mediterranei TaxID=33910 RepID=A0A0H3DFR3_AMYMU|nr:ricin-type beta-trefoil lectin domain protein [Amycolatopsis mediterranei]ADJ49531.1 alpha-galactosidase [Amycolatopsis mediterranei U32]AEK46509.1 alpha-galactosidase [Amycolatopsis mediterranei S699]AFO81240.1 alpha-galactosidase [Amycolatopsis mediterranei S699]AGT88368.1 alpha-galactosidase [Amycolatopsis mediterranei RB]KDO04928.1 alpha-galactosidase [Amycolatopsis mediterranei]